MYQTENQISHKYSDTPTFSYPEEMQLLTRISNLSRNQSVENKIDESKRQNIQFKHETIHELSSNSSQTDFYKNISLKVQEAHGAQDPSYVLDVKQTKQSENLKPRKKKNEKFNSAFDMLFSSVTHTLSGNFQTPKKVDKITASCTEGKRKKTVLNEIQAQEDCKIYKDGGWNRTKLMLIQTRLSFFQFSFDVYHLTKIKILPQSPTKTKVQNVLKIQVKNQVHFFSLSLDKKFYGLPSAFYIFAKIIDKKMSLLGFQSDQEWQRGEHVQKKATEDSYIYGNIMKKSQHLGHWQSRFVVIKKSGIFSYRDSTQQESYSFHINSDSIRYIWTRFDLMNEHLIIKVKHGISKTQFAIPITQFSNRTTKNWLYCFYRIMPIPMVQK